jgi:ribonuclease Z
MKLGFQKNRGVGGVSDFTIRFLGTASAVPTRDRGLSCQVVQYGNEFAIFDCGEGAQRAAIVAGISFSKDCSIFITHLHGDHVVGLLGLMQTMALYRRERPLYVFGPKGIIEFIKYNHEILKFGVTYEVRAKAIRAGTVFDDPRSKYRVRAERSQHSILSYAYVFEEKDKPGRFDPSVARALGVPEGPLWSKLQSGEDVRSPKTGRIVHSSQVLGPPRRGRRIGFSGDSRPTEKLVRFFRGCDVIVFDSTYGDEHSKNAVENFHSTSREAATLAKQAGAKRLILTHFSARYRRVASLVRQAREVFPETVAAHDQLTYDLSTAL